MLQYFERVAAPLSKADVPEALRICKAENFPVSRDLISTLERGQKLWQAALDQLAKNPPSTDIRFAWNKIDVSGKLVRIEDSKAWIKSDSVEVPIDIAALPHECVLQALKFNELDPHALADKATLMFFWGDIEQALALLKKVAPDNATDLRGVLDQRQALLRLKEFEVTVSAIELAIKQGQRTTAVNLLDKLTRGYPELAGGEQQERLKLLSEGARTTTTIKSLVQKVFKSEIRSIDEDCNIELRCDFVKNPQCFSDFVDTGLKVNAAGLQLPGVQWNFIDPQNGLLCKTHFQPGTLRVEFVIDSGNHDLYLGQIGDAKIKVRWFDGGQIDFTFVPKYNGGFNTGVPWKVPAQHSGKQNHTFERTAESVRFLLNGQELGSTPALKALPPEKYWLVGITCWEPCVIKEIIISGKIDRTWLNEASR